jgi:hypothetical protein
MSQVAPTADRSLRGRDPTIVPAAAPWRPIAGRRERRSSPTNHNQVKE